MPAALEPHFLPLQFPKAVQLEKPLISQGSSIISDTTKDEQLSSRKCLGYFVTELAQLQVEAFDTFFFNFFFNKSHQPSAMHGCNFHPDR